MLVTGIYGQYDHGAEIVHKRHNRYEYERFTERFVSVHAFHNMRCEQQEVAAEDSLDQNARFVSLHEPRHDQAEQQHRHKRDRDGIDYDTGTKRRPDIGLVYVVEQHYRHGELVDESGHLVYEHVVDDFDNAQKIADRKQQEQGKHEIDGKQQMLHGFAPV